ncbi:hypothetical protein NEOLEDRAFT_1141201 [Neolentinus lepideus HHB14362 ss-1]|uniref:RING-type domain-containing protein n=1 Tax=Neolentinus lepideus HHB14362 ss-1 TaxID=1314782 RepID=A0A165NU45_9AGAM|nr:hypothetical protein NEOLEDRAFT_1141201 [Neolentinus lepideus HHB14362 ss-1]
MTRAECNICIDSLPVERFRVPPCGHAFCERCLLKYLDTPPVTRGKPCPQCRKAIRRTDLRPLFLTFSSSGLQHDTKHGDDEIMVRARDVSEKLGRMDERSSSKTFERAGRELEKVAKVVAPEGRTEGIAQFLIWDAVNEFQRRIAPTLAETDTLREEVRTLKVSTEFLHRERDRIQARVVVREGELARTLATLEEALEANLNLKSERAELEAECIALKARETATAEQYEKLVLEKNKWQATMPPLKAKAKKYKQRISDLEKDVARLEKEVEDKTRCLEETAQQMPPEYTSYPSQNHRDLEHDSDFDYRHPFFDEDEDEDDAESLYIGNPTSIAATPSSKSSVTSSYVHANGRPKTPLYSVTRPQPQPPRWVSEWQLNQPGPKRRKANPTPPPDFPVALDLKGRTTRPVQLGAKRKLSCA